jgi:hypothetical protein
MTQRSESDVLKDLERLCTSPGYIHALSLLVLRDCYLSYSEEATPEDFLAMHNLEKLNRNEICTLLGLVIRQPVNKALPTPDVVQSYINETDSLMLELHHAITPSMQDAMSRIQAGEDAQRLFSGGAILREAVFYAGESAYNFQYRDLAVKKYSADSEWLQTNFGFDISEAILLSKAISDIQLDRITQLQDIFPSTKMEDWTVLPAFEFTIDDLLEHCPLPEVKVRAILRAFTVPSAEHNIQFRALSDFNVINAMPIIPISSVSFVLLNSYSLLEAIYESPFFWMYKDDGYRNTAQENRGRYLENFSSLCLSRVFGSNHVHQNVLIKDGKGNALGEIDVLVRFGNRAVVLQAKTKRMTIEARRGNDRVIKSDFAKSVQDAYDQARSCAELLLEGNYALWLSDGTQLQSRPIRKCYLLCVVSDNYPALSFQSSHFLQRKPSLETISAPFVMDVFTLDTMAEMLNSPLFLLSYIDRRTGYDDRLSANHELTILSHHLKRNLWMSTQYDRMMLMDDISADLDLAMTVRREGIPGQGTPDGILTHPKGTPYRDLIVEIEREPRSELIDLGMMMLMMG